MNGMGGKRIRTSLALLPALVLAAALPAGAADAPDPGAERVWVVNEYRYDPEGSGGDREVGQALCATRCNALSVDYRTYLEPGGWRLIKVAENREMSLPLESPFMAGRCICVVDEYTVQVNDFNRPKTE